MDLEAALKAFKHNSSYEVESYGFEIWFSREYKEAFTLWTVQNWWQSIVYSMVYVCLMFAIRRIMEPRKPYNLRPLLITWDALLAAMSIFGTCRMFPELIHSITHHSLQYAICVPSFYEPPSTFFWATVFMLSKVVELGDTLFIVLRKQPLIFLHWYHHITVMVYVWVTAHDPTGPGRWFMDVNYLVHAVMYTYYTLRAMRFRIPKQVNIIVTILQLSQMILGSVLNIWVYILQNRGETCYQSSTNFRLSTLMYLSYFALFGNYFYQTYVIPSNKPLYATKPLSGKPIKNGYTSYSNGTAVSNGNGHVQINGYHKKDD